MLLCIIYFHNKLTIIKLKYNLLKKLISNTLAKLIYFLFMLKIFNAHTHSFETHTHTHTHTYTNITFAFCFCRCMYKKK